MTVRSVAIGEIAVLNPKQPELLSDDDITVPFLPMAAVRADGNAPNEQRRRLADLASGYTYFEKGDVLLAKITPCFENGKVAHLEALSHPFGFGSTEFHVLRAGPTVEPRYLYHAVRNPRFLRAGASSMTGSAGQQRVPATFLARHRIPLPPLGEQRRIAAMLDKADAVQRKQRERLRLLDALLRSAFLEMFGDPERNEEGWESRRLGEIAKITTGNTPSRSHDEYYGEDIEWIKADNINTPHHVVTVAKERLSSRGRELARVVGPNSVLVTCIAGSRDAIGKVAIADRFVAFNQQINALESGPDTDHRFLYAHLLVARGLVQRASTNSMKGMVSKSALAAIRMINPPHRLQIEFGEWFSRWHVAHSHTRRAAELGHLLSESLQGQAFRHNVSGGLSQP